MRPLDLFKQMGNKGQMASLTAVGYGLMILGITLGLGVYVLATFQGTAAVYNTSAANTTVLAVIGAFTSLTGWLPIIIIVIVVGLILSLLGFAFGRQGAA
jgi:hypothetical protein